MNLIDLRSDTKTRPSRGMRQAMADADVGDEQLGEDPSVNRLCAEIAGMLGHDAGLFLPSGTMCNQICVAVLCRPGDEILAAENSHLYNLEGAGTAAIAGVQIRPIPTDDGLFSIAAIERAAAGSGYAAPRVRAISIEQTANLGGGTVWPIEQIEEIGLLARSRGWRLSLDGARLLNACAATGYEAGRYAGVFDLAWLDLTKGLGCPVGAVLVGPSDAIDEARYWKQRLGGGLRQAGILAAAGLYALGHNVARLAEDHANARRLAEALNGLDEIRMVRDRITTNIVLLATTGPAADLAVRLAERGVLVNVIGPNLVRMVTHLDFSADAIPDVVGAFESAAAKRGGTVS